MKITVQAMGLTPHQPLEEYIDKKLGKLDTFYDKIINIYWYHLIILLVYVNKKSIYFNFHFF